MQQQTATEFLQQIEKYDLIIKNKSVELYELQCLATSTTAPLRSDPVKTSGTSDKVGSIATKMVYLQSEINTLIDQYIEEKQKRIAVIEQVSKPLYYKILYKRYVEHEKHPNLTAVAKSLHFSTGWISKKHDIAIAEVAEILKRQKE